MKSKKIVRLDENDLNDLIDFGTARDGVVEPLGHSIPELVVVKGGCPPEQKPGDEVEVHFVRDWSFDGRCVEPRRLPTVLRTVPRSTGCRRDADALKKSRSPKVCSEGLLCSGN